jgi:peptide-methionine (R)-S-oxide reductase
VTRRQFLFVGGTTVVLAPVLAWYERPAAIGDLGHFPVTRSDAQWRQVLSSEQYRVLRGRGTERPFSSPLDHEQRRGTFVCAGCGHPLFSSDTKYDSGTGWPSFWTPLPDAIVTRVDTSWFMVRSEVLCARCGSHIGHVFDDGPKPTGLRYCMNGVALRFVQAA